MPLGPIEPIGVIGLYDLWNGNFVAQLSGKSLIGFARGTTEVGAFRGINPATGEELSPTYYAAGADEVDRAAILAAKAFEVYRNTSGALKAAFLRGIAANIEKLNETLVKRAVEETALPAARISAEILFGDWLMAN